MAIGSPTPAVPASGEGTHLQPRCGLRQEAPAAASGGLWQAFVDRAGGGPPEARIAPNRRSGSGEDDEIVIRLHATSHR
jgi:hypothetical protein